MGKNLIMNKKTNNATTTTKKDVKPKLIVENSCFSGDC